MLYSESKTVIPNTNRALSVSRSMTWSLISKTLWGGSMYIIKFKFYFVLKPEGAADFSRSIKPSFQSATKWTCICSAEHRYACVVGCRWGMPFILDGASIRFRCDDHSKLLPKHRCTRRKCTLYHPRLQQHSTLRSYWCIPSSRWVDMDYLLSLCLVILSEHGGNVYHSGDMP